ncbi:hypothetical protein BC792_101258 [Sphingobacterium allocomposti]|uniref:Uncharacterized protein n=1 Tax=Sphingobacterium allocomposti TaxID=415956 RepID=A0A5S5DRN9_9SPHI|nr:hypothetical protein BC792_101258 [Sphingobacterium composti Yoo et al. 2007 non Ten et al. 2007]
MQTHMRIPYDLKKKKSGLTALLIPKNTYTHTAKGRIIPLETYTNE